MNYVFSYPNNPPLWLLLPLKSNNPLLELVLFPNNPVLELLFLFPNNPVLLLLLIIVFTELGELRLNGLSFILLL